MRAQGRPGRRGRDWPAEQRRLCCLESQPEPPRGGHGPGLSPVRSFLVLTDGSRPWTVGAAGGEQCRDRPALAPARWSLTSGDHAVCMRTLRGEGALAPGEHGLPEPCKSLLPTVPLISGTLPRFPGAPPRPPGGALGPLGPVCPGGPGSICVGAGVALPPAPALRPALLGSLLGPSLTPHHLLITALNLPRDTASSPPL